MRRWWAIWWAAGAAAAALSCANQAPPPGGPPDTEPPTVTATTPDSAATEVAVDAGLAVEFSEPMDKKSVADAVFVSPPVDFGRRRWRGRRYQLSGGEFQPNKTYTVIVAVDCRDARGGLRMRRPHQIVFSTGSALDTGQLAGRLEAAGQPAAGTWVWAFDLEAASQPDTVLPDYIAQVGADSTFSFLGLKVGHRYRIGAHADHNKDGEFDRDTEFMAFYPDTLLLTPRTPEVTALAIDFRDPKAPGRVTGWVTDPATAEARATRAAIPPAPAAQKTREEALFGPFEAAAVDSLEVIEPRVKTIYRVSARQWTAVGAVPDSTTLVEATTDSTGTYTLKELAPGHWQVVAYFDVNLNSRYDAREPRSSAVDSVQVLPLETTADVHLVVPIYKE